MWSAEDSLVGDAPGLPIGMVYMFDPANLSALPLKVTVPTSYHICCAVLCCAFDKMETPKYSTIFKSSYLHCNLLNFLIYYCI